MKADEYDWFIGDPSGFIFRHHLPPICGRLKGLQSLLSFSILVASTPDDVRSYWEKLFDTAGKDGLCILDAATGMDDAKIENVRAMFDFSKEYGIY